MAQARESGPAAPAAAGAPRCDRVAAEIHPDPGRAPTTHGHNPIDIVGMVYFGVTGVLILVFGMGRVPRPGWFLALHAAVLAGLFSLRWAPRTGLRGLVRFLRDWYLVLPIAWVFLEVKVLNRIFHSDFHDERIQAIERAIFGGFPSVSFREAVPSVLLSELLHFSYFSYYLIFPGLGIMLYARRKFAQFRTLVTATATTMFGCYFFFIAYPVKGPYYFMKPPPPETIGWFFTALARGVVDSGSAVGTAFPSSHMAVAVSIWLSAFRFARPLAWIYLPLVLGIGFGAVYAGFHYAFDMMAGSVYGALLWSLGVHVDTVLARRFGLPPSA